MNACCLQGDPGLKGNPGDPGPEGPAGPRGQPVSSNICTIYAECGHLVCVCV